MLLYFTVAVRILYQRAKVSVIQLCLSKVAKMKLNTDGFGAGLQDVFGLCKNVFIYKKLWLCDFIRFVDMMKQHCHGFGCGCGFIEQ